jgi:hypothetical protein
MAHLYLWSSKFCGLLVHQRRGDRAVGSGGFLPYACYCVVSVTFLCKYFMFFIYIVYVYSGVV